MHECIRGHRRSSICPLLSASEISQIAPCYDITVEFLAEWYFFKAQMTSEEKAPPLSNMNRSDALPGSILPILFPSYCHGHF